MALRARTVLAGLAATMAALLGAQVAASPAHASPELGGNSLLDTEFGYSCKLQPAGGGTFAVTPTYSILFKATQYDDLWPWELPKPAGFTASYRLLPWRAPGWDQHDAAHSIPLGTVHQDAGSPWGADFRGLWNRSKKPDEYITIELTWWYDDLSPTTPGQRTPSEGSTTTYYVQVGYPVTCPKS